MNTPGPGRLALQACIAEVLAPKAGNVHPGAAFDDATWRDFAVSAMVCEPLFDQAATRGVGQTILDCVKATRDATGHNTNLGIILLLAPLCACESLDDLPAVLQSLDARDTARVYEAIALASPGGLGDAPRADVHDAPPDVPLVEAMRLAADRDAVARQYVNDFADVIDRLAPRLGEPLDESIVRVHLMQMAHEPDSLIARKCGEAVAREAQQRAAAVLAGDAAFESLDVWLRDGEHKRNPGTSADLVAAAVFVALRKGCIAFPIAWAQGLSSLT